MKRSTYLLLALLVISAGVISRIGHTGIALFDKYLGDALYAVLLYFLLRILQPRWQTGAAALASLVLVFLIESFQLTGIPASMARSGNTFLKLIAIVLGTSFRWYDVLAYTVGIGIVALADWAMSQRKHARHGNIVPN